MSLLSGNNAGVIVDELEHAERRTREAFLDALRENLPYATEDVLREQLWHVINSHDIILP